MSNRKKKDCNRNNENNITPNYINDVFLLRDTTIRLKTVLQQ